jgi:hypothetical protein
MNDAPESRVAPVVEVNYEQHGSCARRKSACAALAGKRWLGENED